MSITEAQGQVKTSMRQIRFTKEGYEDLKKEYEQLLKQRPEAVDDLKKARDLGDLSENGYYRAARTKLSALDGKLRRVAFFLKQGSVVENTNKTVVNIGNTVVLSDGKSEVSYHIVGDLEAEPGLGKISLLSPIGRGLAGRRVGDEVTITIPSGKITYRVAKIA